MKTLFAIVAALTISGAASGLAHAQASAAAPRTALVAYVDLDLDTPQGRRTLERRIDRAIRQVCPGRPHPSEMLKSELWRACIASARQDADDQVAALYGRETLALNAIRITGQTQGSAR